MNSTHVKNLLAGALGALLLAAPAAAVITPTINYQGYLISKITNLPVETPQDLKFYIYDTPTGITSPLFSETRCDVRVTKGRYDVEIGSAVAGGIPASIFAERDGLWLEIQVDGDNDCAGAFEAMSPRVKLQASPYSFSSVYATTSSVATSMFLADTIGAHPTTANGAITISTNLFVLGGISVGSISPGQTLAVAGMVESKGSLPACADDLSCGFKFPDGSVQTRAAALTMWEVAGPHVYSINPGNVSIGQNNTNPQARLHISSAAGDTGDLLLVSTGTSQLFLVNGLGQVHGGSFYGDGTTLTGVLRKAGDTMTGQLTLSGSTLTVASAEGLLSPKIKFAGGIELSSAAAAQRGGIFISSHVYLMPGATFYGDGSGLINLISSDTSKVLKAGDTMTGQLTLAGSTLTVTGSAFSVGGSSLSVLGGNTAIGSASYLARLTVGGGIIATSSITAQGSMHAASVHAPSGIGNFYNVTATTGTIWGWDPGTTYSLDTASGVLVRAGVVNAPYFVGNGSLLTSVTGTDSTKLLKAGDTMTGNFIVSPASATLASFGAHKYALTVSSSATSNAYTLAVTTAGRVGVLVPAPAAPLDVAGEAMVSYANTVTGAAKLSIKSYNDYSYIHWTNSSLVASGGVNLGVLGYPGGLERDLIYRAVGSDPWNGGQEVFRVKADQYGNWLFGIGSSPSPADQPREKFHVMANLLVSSATANAMPLLYVSTTAGKVSIGTTAQTHLLTVNGGINAVSSVTAQGGFFGDGSGLTNLVTDSLPGLIQISTITARTGGLYDAVLFSTSVYVQNKLAVGGLFNPQSDLHLKGQLRLDQKAGEEVVLSLYPNLGGNSYIVWNEGATPQKGVLGMVSSERDLVYRGGATTLGNGVQAFRIKDTGPFIVGEVDKNFLPASRLHVATDLTVSVSGAGSTPALYVSTASRSLGVNTGAPQARLHVDGYSLFSASASVLGGGLAGTQSVLEVVGSTLVVRANGTVGIGVASPAERLDVAGKVKATGFAASRERVSAPCPANTICAAGCTAGKVLMGGGCTQTGTVNLLKSYPSSDTVWTCEFASNVDITAYAICSTVE
ncbi:MAG: hypothetical protein A2X29_08895 [Elusimicrobia bacterium GWA2_64_40]|nr:MAG: hypothetical protein A2X29_08895 [Elusimicrobia bacterium GWA2_64_40]OGR65318.1 MAG: hypothetical protein A2X30_08855 [Elusimicrobia bacterium GWB2_63_16]HAN04333.1 hypothetical protein [Elusimicrobiota bacterium]